MGSILEKLITGGLRTAWFILLTLSLSLASDEETRPSVEIPYGEETLRLEARTIERSDERIVARGRVLVTYSDAELRTEEIIYDPGSQEILAPGEFELKRGESWLRGSRAVLSVEEDKGVLHDVSGFTDEELYVDAQTLTRTGEDTYLVEDGYLTACEDQKPKWSFKVKSATIRVGGMARLRRTTFRVKNIPVFYFPYLLMPTTKKERSSGFLLPSIGNSNNKGRRITNRFYLVLGRSADVLLQQEYFSERGFGSGFNLRTRPNEVTRLDLSGEFVDDRKGRGGASLEGFGETRFRNGFRAVADFSLVSNFRFRQTFSDNFFRATRPTEESRLFLTHNQGSRSFNLLLGRQETAFTGRNIVIQTTPGFHFRLLGQRLGNLPLYLDLESSVSGMNRSDQFIETPKVTQRFDLHPKIFFSVPLFQGLRLTPQLGFRQSFYSDRVIHTEEGREISGDSLHRQYLDFQIDLRGWGLSRIWKDSQGGGWKHLIEPTASYRYIAGIDDFEDIIRFDSIDTVANTNAIEYGIVNRIFRKSGNKGTTREWLSIKIAQEHFFDPAFGGALREQQINQFFPLNTLTGIPYAVRPRDFSPLSTTIRVTPSQPISLDARADFDAETGDFRVISLTGFLRKNQFSLATTYFVTNGLLDGIGQNNQVQARLNIGRLERGLSTSAGFTYDARSNRFLNHLVRLNYFWDCCGVSLEAGGFNLTARNEQQVRFSFYLKGIGTFGTIRRPEDVF